MGENFAILEFAMVISHDRINYCCEFHQNLLQSKPKVIGIFKQILKSAT